MAGKLAPEMAKPLPATLTECTVNAAVPDEVRVSVFVDVVFTVTLPKARLPALKVSCGVCAAVPVPLSVTVLVPPLDELLETVMVPLAAPAAVGSKRTCSVIDWPGFNVAGKLAPEMAKPLPATIAECTVNAAVPEEVRVSVFVDVVFTVTLPKARLPALKVSCGVCAAVPVPLSVTVLVPPLDELLETVMVPLAAPAAVGSKRTCSVIDWPGFNVAGKLAPEMAKPLPATITECTVSAAVPEDVRVSVFVDVEFTVTLPKARLPALKVSCGVCAAVPVPLSVTVLVPPLDELLETVIVPLAAPAAVGSK